MQKYRWYPGSFWRRTINLTRAIIEPHRQLSCGVMGQVERGLPVANRYATGVEWPQRNFRLPSPLSGKEGNRDFFALVPVPFLADNGMGRH